MTHAPMRSEAEKVREYLQRLRDIKDYSRAILRQIDDWQFDESSTLPSEIDRLRGELNSLSVDLRRILDQKSLLRHTTPVSLMRKWAVLCIRISLRRLMRTKRIPSTHTNALLLMARVGILWAYQAASLATANELFTEVFHNTQFFVMKAQDLKKGDVLLSYKTASHLKHDILSRLVSIATANSITHSYIVVSGGDTPRLLSASATRGGLIITAPVPEIGEILLIMRPSNLSPKNMKRLDEIITKWDARIMSGQHVPFAELKSWIATFYGLIYLVTGYLFGYPILFKNFITDKKKLYCSEAIDVIFKEAGLIIMPRSEHDAVVGPTEFAYSPYLTFQGIILNDQDQDTLRKELIREFNIQS